METIGVHKAKKLLDTGNAVRCGKAKATHRIPRSGIRTDYYIKITTKGE